MKKIFLLTFVLILGLLLVACGGAAEQPAAVEAVSYTHLTLPTSDLV